MLNSLFQWVPKIIIHIILSIFCKLNLQALTQSCIKIRIHQYLLPITPLDSYHIIIIFIY